MILAESNKDENHEFESVVPGDGGKSRYSGPFLQTSVKEAAGEGITWSSGRVGHDRRAIKGIIVRSGDLNSTTRKQFKKLMREKKRRTRLKSRRTRTSGLTC